MTRLRRSRLGLDIPAIESPEGQDRMAGPAAIGTGGTPPTQADYGPGDPLACPVQAAVSMNAVASAQNEHQANEVHKHVVTSSPCRRDGRQAGQPSRERWGPLRLSI